MLGDCFSKIMGRLRSLCEKVVSGTKIFITKIFVLAVHFVRTFLMMIDVIIKDSAQIKNAHMGAKSQQIALW